jgi:hypothetical protein
MAIKPTIDKAARRRFLKTSKIKERRAIIVFIAMRNTTIITTTMNNAVIFDYHPFTTCFLDENNVSNGIDKYRNNYENLLDTNKKRRQLNYLLSCTLY